METSICEVHSHLWFLKANFLKLQVMYILGLMIHETWQKKIFNLTNSDYIMLEKIHHGPYTIFRSIKPKLVQ
jgi:hypothetical protein